MPLPADSKPGTSGTTVYLGLECQTDGHSPIPKLGKHSAEWVPAKPPLKAYLSDLFSKIATTIRRLPSWIIQTLTFSRPESRRDPARAAIDVYTFDLIKALSEKQTGNTSSSLTDHQKKCLSTLNNTMEHIGLASARSPAQKPAQLLDQSFRHHLSSMTPEQHTSLCQELAKKYGTPLFDHDAIQQLWSILTQPLMSAKRDPLHALIERAITLANFKTDMPSTIAGAQITPLTSGIAGLPGSYTSDVSLDDVMDILRQQLVEAGFSTLPDAYKTAFCFKLLKPVIAHHAMHSPDGELSVINMLSWLSNHDLKAMRKASPDGINTMIDAAIKRRANRLEATLKHQVQHLIQRKDADDENNYGITLKHAIQTLQIRRDLDNGLNLYDNSDIIHIAAAALAPTLAVSTEKGVPWLLSRLDALGKSILPNADATMQESVQPDTTRSAAKSILEYRQEIFTQAAKSLNNDTLTALITTLMNSAQTHPDSVKHRALMDDHRSDLDQLRTTIVTVMKARGLDTPVEIPLDASHQEDESSARIPQGAGIPSDSPQPILNTTSPVKDLKQTQHEAMELLLSSALPQLQIRINHAIAEAQNLARHEASLDPLLDPERTRNMKAEIVRELTIRAHDTIVTLKTQPRNLLKDAKATANAQISAFGPPGLNDADKSALPFKLLIMAMANQVHMDGNSRSALVDMLSRLDLKDLKVMYETNFDGIGLSPKSDIKALIEQAILIHAEKLSQSVSLQTRHLATLPEGQSKTTYANLRTQLTATHNALHALNHLLVAHHPHLAAKILTTLVDLKPHPDIDHEFASTTLTFALTAVQNGNLSEFLRTLDRIMPPAGAEKERQTIIENAIKKLDEPSRQEVNRVLNSELASTLCETLKEGANLLLPGGPQAHQDTDGHGPRLSLRATELDLLRTTARRLSGHTGAPPGDPNPALFPAACAKILESLGVRFGMRNNALHAHALPAHPELKEAVNNFLKTQHFDKFRKGPNTTKLRTWSHLTLTDQNGSARAVKFFDQFEQDSHRSDLYREADNANIVKLPRSEEKFGERMQILLEDVAGYNTDVLLWMTNLGNQQSMLAILEAIAQHPGLNPIKMSDDSPGTMPGRILPSYHFAPDHQGGVTLTIHMDLPEAIFLMPLGTHSQTLQGPLELDPELSYQYITAIIHIDAQGNPTLQTVLEGSDYRPISGQVQGM